MESSLSVLPDPLSGVEDQLAVDGVGDQMVSLPIALSDRAPTASVKQLAPRYSLTGRWAISASPQDLA